MIFRGELFYFSHPSVFVVVHMEFLLLGLVFTGVIICIFNSSVLICFVLGSLWK